MNKTLSIILPVHNAEASLRGDVQNVLEVAAELSARLRLFIVDDGSTDDTYDLAMELATRFPQIRVVHHADRKGLGPAIAQLRDRVRDDFVLVHDGDSRIDAEQIRKIWVEQQRVDSRASDEAASVHDLRRAAETHAAVAAAHTRLAGFQRLSKVEVADTALARRDKKASGNVGVIPPLPRPNFMGTLANFALGE